MSLWLVTNKLKLKAGKTGSNLPNLVCFDNTFICFRWTLSNTEAFDQVITLWREQGHSALWRGWSGKLFGYGVQGGFKLGLYEYFKRSYSELLLDQRRSVIFFLSGASAQVFADVALCPFEAVKVQVQTQPHFARGLTDGFRKLYVNEGLSGFHDHVLDI
ncbi:mitochondrial phosphate carrier protein 1, mitochondrial-like isoform X2 [Solanum pennellii]|nr:mitochondrial phosphate carrier protein 1, mitochondrial-like isoform X2 [Solanum pennellii]XP_015072339.1 mitochondrial phosphate carrier protein 1, mitochondrial-like isoform X2 [Solanum pennellii]